MAEKKIKTEEVEDGSSEHAIVGTPGFVAAPITALEQSPPLELLVQDSTHPGRPFLLGAMQLARNPQGLSESLWRSEAAALADSHKASLMAYLERISNAPLNQYRLKWDLVTFVKSLLDGPSPNCEYGEQGAARLLIDRLKAFMTIYTSPLRPWWAKPLFSSDPLLEVSSPSLQLVLRLLTVTQTKISEGPPASGISSSSLLGVDNTCESCEKLSQKMDVTVRQIATILASLDVPKSSQDALQKLLDFGR